MHWVRDCLFQSAPAIADGRKASDIDDGHAISTFQSAPAIADGRKPTNSRAVVLVYTFQSAPAIADGRKDCVRELSRRAYAVSIRSRHC